MIQIRFYATLRGITGQAGLEVAHSSAISLRDLLIRLNELFPGLRHNLLDENGTLYHDVPIFVNGRNPRLTGEGINMPLEPDDVISIFSPVSSGRMNVEVMRIAAIDEPEQIP